jgi:hypothetical protein
MRASDIFALFCSAFHRRVGALKLLPVFVIIQLKDEFLILDLNVDYKLVPLRHTVVIDVVILIV